MPTDHELIAQHFQHVFAAAKRLQSIADDRREFGETVEVDIADIDIVVGWFGDIHEGMKQVQP